MNEWSDLMSLVTVQPMSRSVSDIAYGVPRIGGNKNFLVGFGSQSLAVHFNFDAAVDQDEHFIHRMDVILPYLTRRVGPDFTTITPFVPVFRYLLSVDQLTHVSDL